VLGGAASNIDGFLGEINAFLQLSWINIFGAKRCSLDIEKPKFQEVFHSKTNSISVGNNVLDTPTSNIDGFFGEINVFLQITWIGLFRTKRTYLHLENSEWQDVFLSKTNSILTWKQCARCSCF
jgi:hypothetical protein